MGPDKSGVLQCPSPRSRIESGMTDPGSMPPSSTVTPGEDPGSISNG